MVDLSWITENFAIGPAIRHEDINLLKAKGIGCVVDLRSEYKDDENLMRANGIEFLHIPIDDGTSPTDEQMHLLHRWLRSRGNREALIHCQNGAGRSPIVAMALLVLEGMTAAEAEDLVERRHPLAAPNVAQMRFLYELESRLRVKNEPSTEYG